MTRVCKTCGINKPIAEFAVGKGYAGGRRPHCKPCAGAAEKKRILPALLKKAQERQAKKAAYQPPLRQACNVCSVEKDRVEFPKESRCKTGIATECSACKRKRGRELMKTKRQADPEADRAYRRVHYHKNLDKSRAYGAQKARDRAAADPEARNAYQRAAYAKNPFRMREATRRRRAMKAGVFTENFTEDQWLAILEANDHRCSYCLQKCDALEPDHMVALARGGEHTAANITPACETCNTSKNDKSLLEIFNTRLLIGQRMGNHFKE